MTTTPNKGYILPTSTDTTTSVGQSLADTFTKIDTDMKQNEDNLTTHKNNALAHTSENISHADGSVRTVLENHEERIIASETAIDALTPDSVTNLGARLTNIDNKLEEITSVLDFGAKGDGTTDDTAALQAWLDVPGKNKELKNGVFRITSGLTSSEAGRTIKTDGATILADSANIVALTITGDKTKVSVDIDGNNKAAIGVSVLASGCDIKKCKIENLLGTTQNGCGIRAETSGGVRIEGNTILNVSATANGTLGDNLGASRAILVTSTTAASALNIVKDNTIAGILGEEGDAIQFLFYDGSTFPFLNAQGIIQDNTIKNCNRRAIKIQASNVKVLDNTHVNTLLLADVPNAANLINVIQSNDVIVQGNTLDASLFVGISATGVSGGKLLRCSIKNNIVKSSSTKTGIFFDYMDDSQIEGNTIYDGINAIAGSNSTAVSISDNTLYGGSDTTSSIAMNLPSSNSQLVIKDNKGVRGLRQYLINNSSPDALVQGNYANMGAGLVLTSSTATGSYYKNNINAGPTVPVFGTSTGQVLDGNANM